MGADATPDVGPDSEADAGHDTNTRAPYPETTGSCDRGDYREAVLSTTPTERPGTLTASAGFHYGAYDDPSDERWFYLSEIIIDLERPTGIDRAILTYADTRTVYAKPGDPERDVRLDAFTVIEFDFSNLYAAADFPADGLTLAIENNEGLQGLVEVTAVYKCWNR